MCHSVLQETQSRNTTAMTNQHSQKNYKLKCCANSGKIPSPRVTPVLHALSVRVGSGLVGLCVLINEKNSRWVDPQLCPVSQGGGVSCCSSTVAQSAGESSRFMCVCSVIALIGEKQRLCLDYKTVALYSNNGADPAVRPADQQHHRVIEKKGLWLVHTAFNPLCVLAGSRLFTKTSRVSLTASQYKYSKLVGSWSQYRKD